MLRTELAGPHRVDLIVDRQRDSASSGTIQVQLRLEGGWLVPELASAGAGGAGGEFEQRVIEILDAEGEMTTGLLAERLGGNRQQRLRALGDLAGDPSTRVRSRHQGRSTMFFLAEPDPQQ